MTLSDRIKALVEKNPTRGSFHETRGRPATLASEYDRLQKLASLLPECVEALEQLQQVYNEYLNLGGLFNPELMRVDGEKLGQILDDATTGLAKVSKTIDELEKQ